MFVTLFNLQGAHRSQRREFILPSRFALVKHFFQVFQNFFQRFSKRKPSGSLPGRPRGRPVYITTASSLCQALFQIFFDLFSRSTRFRREFSAALADSLRRIPHPPSLVKHFFLFFAFFLPGFPAAPLSSRSRPGRRTVIPLGFRPLTPCRGWFSIDFTVRIRYHKLYSI